MRGDVRALAVWQPWASLIAIGAKRYETRRWGTHGVGSPLVIYAAQCWSAAQYEASREPAIAAALGAAGLSVDLRGRGLPRGGPVALVDLVRMRRIVVGSDGPAFRWGSCGSEAVPASEVPLGDYRPGRFAWQLENVVPLGPFEDHLRPHLRGRQGIFRPTPQALDAINDQLRGAGRKAVAT